MLKDFHFLRALLVSLLLGLMPGTLSAQDGASADAEALLLTPLSFFKEDDLDFGQIIPSSTAGTVVMDSTGAVTTTGGVIQINGTQQVARFWGYGSFNQRVRINVNANTHTLTRDGGTETMLMDQVLIGSAPPTVITTSPRTFRIVNANGYFAFSLAGRLRVAANQTPGVYSGEFSVTLEYQ